MVSYHSGPSASNLLLLLFFWRLSEMSGHTDDRAIPIDQSESELIRPEDLNYVSSSNLSARLTDISTEAPLSSSAVASVPSLTPLNSHAPNPDPENSDSGESFSDVEAIVPAVNRSTTIAAVLAKAGTAKAPSHRSKKSVSHRSKVPSIKTAPKTVSKRATPDSDPSGFSDFDRDFDRGNHSDPGPFSEFSGFSDGEGCRDGCDSQRGCDSSTSSEHKPRPSTDDPFWYDGKVVHYNHKRGVPFDAPLLLGPVKPSHHGRKEPTIQLDPGKGSFRAGVDNFSDSAGSFITGTHNSIKRSRKRHDADCGASAILGGSHNQIHSDGGATIVQSRGVSVVDSENTVVLGVNIPRGAAPFSKFKNSTITQHLYALNHLTAGPIPEGARPTTEALYVNGDAAFTRTILADTVVVQSLVAETATVNHVTSPDRYLAGSGGATGTTFILRPTDTIDIVYVNTIGGQITIQLGESGADVFRPNQKLVIKDVNPEFGNAASYNANIVVPPEGVRIEHYSGSTIVANTGAGYALNTGGGSVTFRYSNFGIPGSLPTWVIESQLVGNPRTVPTALPAIGPASARQRATLLGYRT